jgi:hypothetical protein
MATQRTGPTKPHIMTNLTHPTGWPHDDLHQIEALTMPSIRFIRTVFPLKQRYGPSNTIQNFPEKIPCSALDIPTFSDQTSANLAPTSLNKHHSLLNIHQRYSKIEKNDKPRAPQRNPTSSTIIDGNTRPFRPSCRWHVPLVAPCTRATCEGAEARIQPRPRRADEAYHGRGLPPGAFRVRHDTSQAWQTPSAGKWH